MRAVHTYACYMNCTVFCTWPLGELVGDNINEIRGIAEMAVASLVAEQVNEGVKSKITCTNYT